MEAASELVAGKYLGLTSEKPTEVQNGEAKVLELHGKPVAIYRSESGEALQTGRPQNESKGVSEDLFGPLYADLDRLKGFLAAMSGISAGPAQAIASKFSWTNYRTFVDVGCAQGMVPVTLARSHAAASRAY